MGTFVTGTRKQSADWHGTGVLALLTGDPHTTTPGLIPQARFFVADVFSQDAAGSPIAESLSLLKALDWMDAFGVKIINLSLTGPKDPLIQEAIVRLSKKGILFIAAAGNNGPTAPPSYPAAYKPVIAVTAVNKELRSYRHANRGAFIDIAAPGVKIWTAAPGKNEGYRSGTSFAVPFVTAVACSALPPADKTVKGSLMGVISTKDLGARVTTRFMDVALSSHRHRVTDVVPLEQPQLSLRGNSAEFIPATLSRSVTEGWQDVVIRNDLGQLRRLPRAGAEQTQFGARPSVRLPALEQF